MWVLKALAPIRDFSSRPWGKSSGVGRGTLTHYFIARFMVITEALMTSWLVPVVSHYFYLAWKTRTGSLTKGMTGDESGWQRWDQWDELRATKTLRWGGWILGTKNLFSWGPWETQWSHIYINAVKPYLPKFSLVTIWIMPIFQVSVV